MSDPSAEQVLAKVELAYRRHLDSEPARASVSFVGVEPIEVLRFPENPGQRYLSLGMSRQPVTSSDAILLDAHGAPRAELLLSTVGSTDEVWRHLAVLAAAPVVQARVYRSGDRVQLDVRLVAGSRCIGGVLVDSDIRVTRLAGVEPVQILQILPATASELAWSRVHGSQSLVERWRHQRTPLRDLMREPASLA